MTFVWRTRLLAVAALMALCALSCERHTAPTAPSPGASNSAEILRGASSYTPYDSFAMLWHREDPQKRPVAWVSSGAEAGRLLASIATMEARPAWVHCTQGVVAGLAARGEKVAIIATVYASDAALRPVFRKPKPPLDGARGAYIPRSSIEVAFDRLLERERVPLERIRIPHMERVGFDTLKAMMEKPADDASAIDFTILVDPFITNLMTERPGEYELGEGGLYDMRYCIAVRREDIESHRDEYAKLLEQMISVETKLREYKTDDEFLAGTWGRESQGRPERLPRLITFDRSHLRLELDAPTVRRLLREEIEHLVQKYPRDLAVPESLDSLVETSVLTAAAPDRVRP